MHAKAFAIRTTLALITSVKDYASWTLEFYSDDNCGGNAAVIFSDNSDTVDSFFLDGCIVVGDFQSPTTGFKASGDLHEAGGYLINVWPNADCTSTDNGNGSGQIAIQGSFFSSTGFSGINTAWGSFQVIRLND
ncbi:hypothetical protein LTR17_027727 [Elasticomyces elasticus]|nr:hypothetical protein LTR17_027727 [Elasticomyces elasticus]